MRTRRRSGFTLIELLLVMSILVLLVGIAGVKYVGYRRDAAKKTAITQIGNFKSALELFESTNDRFPTTQEGLNALVQNPNPQALPDWKKLMDSIPLDPWGHPYRYTCPGSNSKDYDITSDGPSGQQGAADSISN